MNTVAMVVNVGLTVLKIFVQKINDFLNLFSVDFYFSQTNFTKYTKNNDAF